MKSYWELMDGAYSELFWGTKVHFLRIEREQMVKLKKFVSNGQNVFEK